MIDFEGIKIKHILNHRGWDGLSEYYGKDIKPIEVKMWEQKHGKELPEKKFKFFN